MEDTDQVGRRLEVDDLYRLQIPESPALCPAADRVVYVLRTVDVGADRDLTCLWRVGVHGEEPAQLTWGPEDTAPAWSPDGKRLAFLRATGQGPQVWTMPVDGGEPRQLSSLPHGAGRPVWSPNGSSIAVVAPVAGDEGRATDPVVVERLGYRADGVGLYGNRRSHIHVLDARTGKARALTGGDWHAGDPAWAPDGSRLAFPAAPDPDADLTLTSQTYVVEVDSPGSLQMVGEPNGRAGPVCWTPDGQELLVAGRRTADAGHTSLLRVPVYGGRTLDVTEAFDRNVMPGALAYPGGLPAVVDDGHAVVVCARDGGNTQVWRVDLDHGTRTRLIDDPGSVVSGLSVAGGLAAVVLADSSTFGEIDVIDVIDVTVVAAPRKLTDHTREALPDVELYLPEQGEFRAPDGGIVHAWVVRDPVAPKPAPLVLDLHGGPHNAWHPAPDAAHLYHQALAARGFTVVLPNPRGSDGFGEAFHNAALGAWGGADEQDVLAPVDRLVAEGQADPERLGVCGYSYGGFLTCHLTGRIDRFAAAVTGGVVANLVSLAGTSAERQELATLEWRAFPHGDTDALRAQSPIERVERVSTPTLILHGLADELCPAGQAEEWFTALRQRGVPAQMVLYPDASHSFVWSGRPSHRADYGNRIVDWMERHLSGSSQPAVQAVPGPPRSIADEHWRQRLAGLASEHGVPGAALGITRVDGIADQTVLVSSGVLNTATGVPVTPESVFELGSVTKPMTATVIMQLVDEGKLDLDAPVREVLPELRLADPDLIARVTMRHLLTHTSGFDGDIFDDTGRGDDCLQRYVARLASAAINHPLGATFSYCNTGYVVAGRVIEVLTGRTWDQAVRERLFRPLGMARACTLPLADLVEGTTRELELFPVEDGLFAMREPGASTWKAATFYTLPDGSLYLHYDGRANPRIS